MEPPSAKKEEERKAGEGVVLCGWLIVVFVAIGMLPGSHGDAIFFAWLLPAIPIWLLVGLVQLVRGKVHDGPILIGQMLLIGGFLAYAVLS